jgi:acyl-coenzyme A synthetase/AMP-(fatty) acid ligase
MSFYSFDFINQIAQVHRQEFAYIDESRKVTFAELDIGTKKIATFLKSIGVKQGTIVALILPTYFNWFFTFALHRMGVGVMSKISYSRFPVEVTPDFIISLKHHPSFPKEKTIIVDSDLMKKVENIDEDKDLSGYSDLLAPARLFSTSGTTGTTRYICYEAEKLEVLATRKSEYDFVGIENIVSMFPFSAGQSYRKALKNMSLGRTYYALNSGGAPALAYIRDNPIRTLYASPSQVSILLDIQSQTKIELPDLNVIIMAGSPPSEKLIERIKSNLNCRIYNSYGSTEAGNIGVVEITDGVKHSGGFDLIHNDVNLEIVDENDKPLPASTVGIIRYRKSNTATSYYKNPVANAQFFKDGYFYPGDLGFVDSAGRLHLEGRSNDVINLGGVKVNPERIESIALAQLGVRDCAAFGRISDSGIEELCIALVVNEDFKQEIFEKAMAAKSANLISQISIFPSIPRNDMGKIARNLLGTGIN